MIVEDSRLDLRLLEKLLEEMGHDIVATAVSGEEAVACALEVVPDLIIMDILLVGDMTGITAANIIRQSYSIPVVFATAVSDKQTLDDAIIDDIYGYLIKPYNKRQLFVSIEIALRRYNFELLLEENEIKYRTLFHESMDGIFICNRDGRFADCNRAMLEMLGYTRNAMMEMSLKDIITNSGQADHVFQALEEKGFIKDFEIEIKSLYKHRIFAQLSVNYLKSTSDHTGRLQGFLKDITEKIAYEMKLKDLNTELEQHIIDLNNANRFLSLSEEKYRLLVEGTNDIIFSLDENWNFKTVNNAIKKQLNYFPQQVQSMNFLDTLYNAEEESVSRQMVAAILSRFARDRNPVSFKAEFKSGYSSEPKELHVKLEYLDIEGKNEILGKAQRVAEDALIKYFVAEKLAYEIGNYLFTAEEISYRITRNLARYIDSREVNAVRISLRELIINAIEHGNLNISFEEKTNQMMRGDYFNFLSSRQNDPLYADKKVIIEYAIDPEYVTYCITDQGEGFDHKSLCSIDVDNINQEMVTHGRGILMARGTFDELEYNEKGNQVIIKKFFKSS